MARPGWYNDNINRSYPFLDGSTDGLPEYAIADFGSMVMAGSGYVEGESTIWLAEIRKYNEWIEYKFLSDAPGLTSKMLVFLRNSDNEDKYYTDYVDAIDLTTPTYIDCLLGPCDSSSLSPCVADAIWTGFLVSGDLQRLSDFLSSTFTGHIPTEPALTQNLDNTYVRTVNVANADRTRATTPEDCRDYCWTFQLEDHYVVCDCVTGQIRLEEGYNTCIRQDPINNRIIISGCVNGGSGTACDPSKVLPDEEPPTGRTLLDGALGCDEIVRSINGIGQRFFQIMGGVGVVVTPVPDEHKITVDVNLNSMALCAQLKEQSSLNAEPEISSECVCGSSP